MPAGHRLLRLRRPLSFTLTTSTAITAIPSVSAIDASHHYHRLLHYRLSHLHLLLHLLDRLTSRPLFHLHHLIHANARTNVFTHQTESVTTEALGVSTAIALRLLKAMSTTDTVEEEEEGSQWFPFFDELFEATGYWHKRLIPPNAGTRPTPHPAFAFALASAP
jgi:hypothetical protein